MQISQSSSKVYRSEITWWLFISTAVVFAGVCAWIILLDLKVFLFALPALIMCALVYYNIFTGTRYTIEGDILHIKCGVFINDRVKIANIRSITKTRSVLSGPALSTDRIMLTVSRRDKIFISPCNRTDFIDSLLRINPNIEVESGLCGNS
ncbi:MAG: PH domain-containing protein [Duncaniella sp.]|nr:PH domain-containing protein [Duncaniella sp.]